MNGEAYYKMGKSYENGENGMAQNINKAMENYLKAIEAGYDGALGNYIFSYEYYKKKPDGERLLNAIEQYGWQKQHLDEYCRALLLCKKLDRVDEVLKYKDTVAERGSLYFAEYLDAAGCEDKELIKNNYVRAMMTGNWRMPSAVIAKMVNKYGVESSGGNSITVQDKELVGQFVNNVQNRDHVAFFAPEIPEDMAQVMAEEQLKVFGGVAKKLQKIKPRAVLEYQRMGGSEYTIKSGVYHYTFSTSTHTGSGNVVLDEPCTYAEYTSDFNTVEKLMDIYNAAKLQYEIPDARINISNTNFTSVEGYSKSYNAAKKAMEAKAANNVDDTFNFGEYASTTVDVPHESTECNDWSYFVPFRFFIYELDGKTYTIRINAVTGKFAAFTNDKFGLGKVGSAKAGGTSSGQPKKFSIGVFLALTLFTGVGGILYALMYLVTKK